MKAAEEYWKDEKDRSSVVEESSLKQVVDVYEKNFLCQIVPVN
jgi:hypothetical protein